MIGCRQPGICIRHYLRVLLRSVSSSSVRSSCRSPARDIRNECARVGPSRWAPVPSTMLSDTRDGAWYPQCNQRLASRCAQDTLERDREGLRGPAPRAITAMANNWWWDNSGTGQAGSREGTRTVSTCPAPIRDRGYVTYRLTVKVTTPPRAAGLTPVDA